MDSTAKQKQANRANGALGGVKTVEGKLISSKNALRHGALANCVTKYDLIDIEQLYDDLAEEFVDTSPSRQFLIQQLALTILRLSRCARAETEILREAINPPLTEVRDSMFFNANLKETFVVSEGEPSTITSESLEKFALIYERYEPRLFTRYLRILEALDKGPCD